MTARLRFRDLLVLAEVEEPSSRRRQLLLTLLFLENSGSPEAREATVRVTALAARRMAEGGAAARPRQSTMRAVTVR
jgi:hypothetical protein